MSHAHDGALRKPKLNFSAFREEEISPVETSISDSFFSFFLEAISGGENHGIPTMFLFLPGKQKNNSYFGQLCLGGVLSNFAHTCLRGQIWRTIEPLEPFGVSFLLTLFQFLSVLLAGVYLFFADAGLALDMAAPLYLAVAGQSDEAQRRVVATSTAKAAAARVLGASAAGRPGRVPRRTAEARRLF